MEATLSFLHSWEYFLTTEAERNFVPPLEWFPTLLDYFWVPCVVSAIYVAIVFAFNSPPPAPGTRPPPASPALKNFEIVWNFLLTFLSFGAAMRTLPRFLSLLIQTGPFGSISAVAAAPGGPYFGPCGFWLLLASGLKFFELIDTIILLAKKRNIIFLHWFHHASVLVYTCHAYVIEMPCFIFLVMNVVIHTFMYWYYFRATLGCRPKWDRLLTTMQIAQMAVGVSVTVALLRYSDDVPHADVNNLYLASAMYMSYFVLFGLFFLKRYTAPKKPKTA